LFNLGLNSLGVALPSPVAVAVEVAAGLFLSTNFGAKLTELDFKDLKRSCDNDDDAAADDDEEEEEEDDTPVVMEDMGPVVEKVAPREEEAVPIPAPPVIDAAVADVVALGGTSTVRRDGSYTRSLFISFLVESFF